MTKEKRSKPTRGKAWQINESDRKKPARDNETRSAGKAWQINGEARDVADGAERRSRSN